jgi:hypothetical protein
MPGTTTRLGLTTMLGADLANTIDDTNDTQMAQIDTLMAVDAQGLAAAKGAATTRGKWYKETDGKGLIYRSDGANWDPIAAGTPVFQQLGLSDDAVVRRGKVNTPTAESTSSTSYTLLTTPDRVQSVVLPTDGLIVVAYQALWQNTVANNARAAIFIGANQLKQAVGISGGPSVAESAGPPEVSADGVLSSNISNGLASVGGAGNAVETTTGQLVGASGVAGGPCFIFAAAGTYDVSVQFKNNAAGTLTVSKRHLWVWTIGF